MDWKLWYSRTVFSHIIYFKSSTATRLLFFLCFLLYSTPYVRIPLQRFFPTNHSIAKWMFCQSVITFLRRLIEPGIFASNVGIKLVGDLDNIGPKVLTLYNESSCLSAFLAFTVAIGLLRAFSTTKCLDLTLVHGDPKHWKEWGCKREFGVLCKCIDLGFFVHFFYFVSVCMRKNY